MLRNRIVTILRYRNAYLLKNLTYTKAKELALAMESAVQGSVDISSTNEAVHEVVNDMPTNPLKCFRCGKNNHVAEYEDAVCRRCCLQEMQQNRALG